MQIKLKKLWMEHASVRDYVVSKLIDNNENLYIEFNGKVVMYTPEDLKKYLDNSYNQKFKSKFNGKEYKLIDLPSD